MWGVKYSTRVRIFFERLKANKERGKRDAIYSISGLVATTAKNLLRVRPGPSRSPAAPHAHTLGGLRLIRFAVDPGGARSIVGPIRFPNSRQYNAPVPAIHEFGKTVFSLKTGWFYKYRERPFMSKAVNKLKNKIPRQYSLSLGKAL